MKVYDLKKALSRPDEVSELYIHNRNLRELPGSIQQLRNLKKLSLSQNQIHALPAWLVELQDLECIDLSANSFEEVPVVLNKLASLQKLNLSKNRIKNLPEDPDFYQTLSSLDLAFNQVTEIPPTVFTTSLKSINLSQNPVEKIPKEIGRAINLEVLKISHANLKKLPAALSKCQSIRTINLDHNQIRALPESLSTLQRLEKLSAVGNKLKSIPEGIGECTWLRELKLNQNKIKKLPDSIGQLSWLFRLNVERNQINTLPKSLGLCKKLRSLNLEKNKLQVLPSTLLDLPNLEQLYVKGNSIVLEKTSVVHWSKLKTLTGLQPQFNARDRKEVLTFLRHCQDKKYNLRERQELYRLLIENNKSTKKILLQAACFPMKRLRERALDQLFEHQRLSRPLLAGSVVVVCGQTHFSRKALKQTMEGLNIKYASQIDQSTTHVVLGHFPEQLSELLKFSGSFIREQALQRYIKEQTKSSLKHFSEKEQESLSRLLLSDQIANVQLAIEILKTGLMTPLILTTLFLAYKKRQPASVKRKLRKILTLNGSEILVKKLSWRISLDERTGKEQLRQNIQKYAEGTELDVERMLEYWIGRKNG